LTPDSGVNFIFVDSGAGSRDFDPADARRDRARGYVGRKQLERFSRVLSLHPPPDRMPAEGARGERRVAAKRSLVAFERCEHGAAFRGFVMVLDEETRHVRSVAANRSGDIGIRP
jgi:hypothetical protein